MEQQRMNSQTIRPCCRRRCRWCCQRFVGHGKYSTGNSVFFIAFFDNTKTVVIRILCVDKGKCALLQRRSRVENDAYVHGDTHTDANTHIHKREPFAICI